MFPVFRFQFTKYTYTVLTVVSSSQHIFISVSPVSELISTGHIMWTPSRPMRGLPGYHLTNQRPEPSPGPAPGLPSPASAGPVTAQNLEPMLECRNVQWSLQTVSFYFDWTLTDDSKDSFIGLKSWLWQNLLRQRGVHRHRLPIFNCLVSQFEASVFQTANSLLFGLWKKF